MILTGHFQIHCWNLSPRTFKNNFKLIYVAPKASSAATKNCLLTYAQKKKRKKIKRKARQIHEYSASATFCPCGMFSALSTEPNSTQNKKKRNKKDTVQTSKSSRATQKDIRHKYTGLMSPTWMLCKWIFGRTPTNELAPCSPQRCSYIEMFSKTAWNMKD